MQQKYVGPLACILCLIFMAFSCGFTEAIAKEDASSTTQSDRSSNTKSDAKSDSTSDSAESQSDSDDSSEKDKTSKKRKGSAKGSKSADKKSPDKDSSSDTASKKEKDDDEPKLSVTEHTAIIDGKPVKYKATAGFMVLKDFSRSSDEKSDDKDDKKSKKDKEPKHLAKMFFIAYTRETASGAPKRPVTFSFNGGPGSASIWLHMGGLGPRRATLTDNGEALPPPYRLEDNNSSWLDESDLVFIDPVSTGYSRPEPGEDASKFHGYDEDIQSVGEFIRLYTTKYKRWLSPKFLVGESYGTTRAAGLSEFLRNKYGLYLNGIVLVSAVLNFATLDMSPGNDLSFALFMPAYASSAWYHKRLTPDLQSKPLNEVLSQAEEFASHDYMLGLFQGDGLSQESQTSISNRLSTLIGLPAGYVAQLNNRIPDDLFFTHLLMDRNLQIGRYDSRYTGIRFNPGRDDPDFDPSFEAVNGPFTATFNDYVRRDLHFESELNYETLANVWPWHYKSAENRYVNVAEDLRKALIRNPYLKVMICCGYYDLATPYFAAKYTVDQMSLPPAIRRNVRLTYYGAGHMMYVTKPSLIKLKSDFTDFLRDAVLPESSVVPSAKP